MEIPWVKSLSMLFDDYGTNVTVRQLSKHQSTLICTLFAGMALRNISTITSNVRIKSHHTNPHLRYLKEQPCSSLDQFRIQHSSTFSRETQESRCFSGGFKLILHRWYSKQVLEILTIFPQNFRILRIYSLDYDSFPLHWNKQYRSLERFPRLKISNTSILSQTLNMKLHLM